LHYREVVVLCNLEEMNYVDAAQALGCAVGTIRSRLHRGHTLLVEKLRDRKILPMISKAEASRGA
jgi:RNA polymerase sigma-70 factor (ECF subfamily)